MTFHVLLWRDDDSIKTCMKSVYELHTTVAQRKRGQENFDKVSNDSDRIQLRLTKGQKTKGEDQEMRGTKRICLIVLRGVNSHSFRAKLRNRELTVNLGSFGRGWCACFVVSELGPHHKSTVFVDM